MTHHDEMHGTVAAYPSGQLLECDSCGARIRILKACSTHPVEQVLQCCGRDMRPASPAREEPTPEGES